jgi:hypothetical protein
MSGFSTSRSGTDNTAKQYGSILRGYGPPVPQAGVVGDLYVDTLTFQFFEKRKTNGLDPWGHYLFTIPSIYQNSLKWFGPSTPSNIIGLPGDYFLQWAGYDNYGMQLTIWGPKLWSGWPESGTSSGAGLNITNIGVYQLGLLDEGPVLTDTMLSQLIATGLADEYIVPLSVTANVNEPVIQLGLQSSGQLVIGTINPLYTAEDEHVL